MMKVDSYPNAPSMFGLFAFIKWKMATWTSKGNEWSGKYSGETMETSGIYTAKSQGDVSMCPLVYVRIQKPPPNVPDFQSITMSSPKHQTHLKVGHFVQIWRGRVSLKPFLGGVTSKFLLRRCLESQDTVPSNSIHIYIYIFFLRMYM